MKGGTGLVGLIDKKLVAVSPSTKIRVAILLARRSNVNMLPVVMEGKLVGIVKDSDLWEYSARHLDFELDEKISEIMRMPVFVESNCTIQQAIKKTVTNNLGRIPVVDSSKRMRCLGIVSSSELLHAAGKAKEKGTGKKR